MRNRKKEMAPPKKLTRRWVEAISRMKNESRYWHHRGRRVGGLRPLGGRMKTANGATEIDTLVGYMCYKNRHVGGLYAPQK